MLARVNVHARFRGAAVGAFLALTACGGGGSGIPTSSFVQPTPPPPVLTALPAEVIIPMPSVPATVTIGGFRNALSVAVTQPAIVVVTPVTGAPAGTYMVTPIRQAGQTSIVFSDGGGAVIVPVTVSVCVPPWPALFAGSPADRQTNVSVNLGQVVLSAQSSGPISPASFAVRLVGSNASVITGTSLAPTQAPAVVPPGTPSSPAWFGSTVGQLAIGTTYQVQVFSPTSACLPPLVTGTFFT